MFCKVCQYPLWNIRERTCPECGTGFAPSGSRFKPNSVQFLCPHCSQQYYGTSATGHLVPREFDCVKCGQHLHMDRMVLVPAPGIDEGRTRARVNPWTERAGRPRIADWFRTTLMSMATPGALIKGTDEGASIVRTLAYAVITITLSCAASIFVPLIAGAPVMALLRINTNRGEALIGYVVGLAVIAALACVLVPLYGLVAHLILRGGKPARGLRTTMHATALSSGGNTLWAPPLFGMMTGLGGLIWWGISLSLMFRAAHRVSRTRATVAGVGPPATLFALIIVGSIVGVIFAMSAAQTALQSVNATTQLAELSQAYTREAAGDERHFASLIAEGKMAVTDVIANNFSMTGTVVVNGVDLGESLRVTTEEDRAALASSFDALLTPDVVAYRVGDVIVIRDVPNPPPDPRLWRLAISLDPSENGQWYSSQGTRPAVPPPFANGAMFGGPTNASINPDVTQQNEVRAMYGLPPLPPLHVITRASPFRVGVQVEPGAEGDEGAVEDAESGPA